MCLLLHQDLLLGSDAVDVKFEIQVRLFKSSVQIFLHQPVGFNISSHLV